MVESFLARYPEFTKVSKALIQLALDDAALELSSRVWGKFYSRGLAALAAHLLYSKGALSKSGTQSGKPIQTVASKSAGEISISYNSPDAGFSANHEALATSSYGQEYLRLRPLVSRHFLVVR